MLPHLLAMLLLYNPYNGMPTYGNGEYTSGNYSPQPGNADHIPVIFIPGSVHRFPDHDPHIPDNFSPISGNGPPILDNVNPPPVRNNCLVVKSY